MFVDQLKRDKGLLQLQLPGVKGATLFGRTSRKLFEIDDEIQYCCKDVTNLPVK